MSQPNIIQVPPNYVVKKWKAVLVQKKKPFDTTIGTLVRLAGVDYHNAVSNDIYVGAQSVIDDYIQTECGVSIQNATLQQLAGMGQNTLTVNLKKGLSLLNGSDTIEFIAFAVPIVNTFCATNTQVQISFDIDAVAGLDPTIGQVTNFGMNIKQLHAQAFEYRITEPFYPFSYETKYAGADNALPYIVQTNPPFVDIDINTLFENPQNLPATSVNDIIYLLHKNA